MQFAAVRGPDRIACLLLIFPFIPDHDRTGAVLTWRDDSLEITVSEDGFDVHGEPCLAELGWRTFRDCPRTKHAFHFQPKVVVETTGRMFLDNESLGMDLSALRSS